VSSWTHDELVEFARKWLLKRISPPKGQYSGGRQPCSVVITDMTSSARETPDAIGWAGWGHSVLVECKASIEDYKRDQYKSFRRHPEEGAGIARYYMAPKGVIPIETLPPHWGLVEVDEQGRTRIKRRSGVFKPDRRGEVEMLLSLLRRLKVKPGKHVSIRAYTMENSSKEPRATVTLVEDEDDVTSENDVPDEEGRVPGVQGHETDTG
jgi:hypothetical protein